MKVGKESRKIVLKFINKFGISLACNHWNSQITFSSGLADYDLSPLEIQRWWPVWASNTVFHSLSVAHIEVAVFTGVKYLVIIPSSKILLDLLSKLKNSSFNLFQCYCSSVTKAEGAISPEELRYISWSNIFTEEQILNPQALTIDEWNFIKLIITPQFRFGYRSFFPHFSIFLFLFWITFVIFRKPSDHSCAIVFLLKFAKWENWHPKYTAVKCTLC